MSEKHTITLIGSGNVAWHLGRGLQKAGHRIEMVYSRSIEKARALAAFFPGCEATNLPDFGKSNSRIFIIAVSDHALEPLSGELVVPENSFVAHTSGSVSIDVLKKFYSYGVFYPLQTFTKGKEVILSEVPFGVEASDEKVYRVLKELALALSSNVQRISSAQRKILHVAAVFASNFTNHLLLVSEQILEKEKLDVTLLHPLVRETLKKAFEIGPALAQTGPAVRGDEKIIQQHLDYLANEPELQQLYKLFSKRIKEERTKEGEK